MSTLSNRTRPAEMPATPESEIELITTGDPRQGVIWASPQRMNGVPCFAGTQVPARTLFDYLSGGETLDDFLHDFEVVKREQAEAAIRLAAERWLDLSASR